MSSLKLTLKRKMPAHEITRDDPFETVYTCKICLEEEDFGLNMIRPCHCSGSVHKVCLEKWIIRRREVKDKKYMVCEVCKGHYRFRMKTKYRLTCEKLQNNISDNTLEVGLRFCLFLILLSLDVGLIAMVAIFAGNQAVLDDLEKSVAMGSNALISILSISLTGALTLTILAALNFSLRFVTERYQAIVFDD